MATESSVAGSPDERTSPRPRRRIGRVLLVVAIVIVAAVGGAYAWLAGTATVQQAGAVECSEAPVAPTSSSEEATSQVCAVIDSLTEAWADQDADAYGALFTPEATYTTFMGTHYQGRTDIVESHRALFDGPIGGTRLADAFLGIEFVAPEVAVVTTRGDTYEGDEPGELTKLQTYVVVRGDDDAWQVAAFHNTQRSPVMERIQFLFWPESAPAAER